MFSMYASVYSSTFGYVIIVVVRVRSWTLVYVRIYSSTLVYVRGRSCRYVLLRGCSCTFVYLCEPRVVPNTLDLKKKPIVL